MSKIFYIRANPNSQSMRGVEKLAAFQAIEELQKDKAFEIIIQEYSPKLPQNLRARLKIPVREMAKFHGITYNQMNTIVHEMFYPKVEKVIHGISYEMTADTNKLTPDEAREIEVNIIQWAVDTGCPLSIPQADS